MVDRLKFIIRELDKLTGRHVYVGLTNKGDQSRYLERAINNDSATSVALRVLRKIWNDLQLCPRYVSFGSLGRRNFTMLVYGSFEGKFLELAVNTSHIALVMGRQRRYLTIDRKGHVFDHMVRTFNAYIEAIRVNKTKKSNSPS